MFYELCAGGASACKKGCTSRVFACIKKKERGLRHFGLRMPINALLGHAPETMHSLDNIQWVIQIFKTSFYNCGDSWLTNGVLHPHLTGYSFHRGQLINHSLTLLQVTSLSSCKMKFSVAPVLAWVVWRTTGPGCCTCSTRTCWRTRRKVCHFTRGKTARCLTSILGSGGKSSRLLTLD